MAFFSAATPMRIWSYASRLYGSNTSASFFSLSFEASPLLKFGNVVSHGKLPCDYQCLHQSVVLCSCGFQLFCALKVSPGVPRMNLNVHSRNLEPYVLAQMQTASRIKSRCITCYSARDAIERQHVKFIKFDHSFRDQCNIFSCESG